MLYIILNGEKQYLSKEMLEEYNLRPGMRTPFGGQEILTDSKIKERADPKDKDTKTSLRHRLVRRSSRQSFLD